MFNEYFTLISEELAAGLDDVSDSGFVYDRNLNSIFLFETAGTEVGKIIDSLDVTKAPGYDQVSARVKKVYSINSGFFPDCLKLAKVGHCTNQEISVTWATTGQYQLSQHFRRSVSIKQDELA
jgi:hypothetical protein